MRTQVATTSRNYKNLLLLTEIKLLFFYGTVMTAGLHFWLSTLLKNWRKKTILNVKMGGLCVFFNLMNFCQFFRILENRRRTPFLMMSEKKIHIWKIPVMPIKENHVSYHCVQIFGIFPPKPHPLDFTASSATKSSSSGFRWRLSIQEVWLSTIHYVLFCFESQNLNCHHGNLSILDI